MGAFSVEQQTGWRRPGAVAICQDIDVLARVSQYDFDLSDVRFLAYAHARGVLYKAGNCQSRRWQATADHALSREAFLADRYFQLSEPHPVTGQQHAYSPEDMETHWRIMKIAKGGLQDCWQLYCARSEADQQRDDARIEALYQRSLGRCPHNPNSEPDTALTALIDAWRKARGL